MFDRSSRVRFDASPPSRSISRKPSIPSLCTNECESDTSVSTRLARTASASALAPSTPIRWFARLTVCTLHAGSRSSRARISAPDVPIRHSDRSTLHHVSKTASGCSVSRKSHSAKRSVSPNRLRSDRFAVWCGRTASSDSERRRKTSTDGSGRTPTPAQYSQYRPVNDAPRFVGVAPVPMYGESGTPSSPGLVEARGVPKKGMASYAPHEASESSGRSERG